MELGATRSKSGYHILGRRLEQSDNIGDEFVLALDCSQRVKLISAKVDGFLYIGSLKQGELGVFIFLEDIFDELRGSIANIREHDGCSFLESGVDFRIVLVERLESLVEKSILDNKELDVGLVAGTAQVRSLFLR